MIFGMILLVIIGYIVFGVLIGLLAQRKGYKFQFWFLSGPINIVALIVLAFLPYVNQLSKLSESEKQIKEKNGNTIGIVLSVIALLAVIYFLVDYVGSL